MANHRFAFNVLIDRDQGVYIAYCLEMGLVATSDEEAVLPHIMMKLISRQIEFALQNDNPADIYHPASAEIWEKWRKATQAEHIREIERTQKQFKFVNWPPVTVDQVSYAAAC